MNEEMARRLREARKKAGYSSAAQAAKAYGWTESAYRHHENGLRKFRRDEAAKYARAFRVKAGWLLCLEGVDDGPVNGFKAHEKLIVGGRAAAGVWRETTDLDTPMLEIDTPPPVIEARRFGVVVEGPSMDLLYEDGTVLDCIEIYSAGGEPQTGDHVVVERIKPDGLRECTVKEFAERNGEYYLVPRSSRPEFKEVKIGKPSGDIVDGDEVRVLGFVVSSIRPAQLALLRRLGKVVDL